MSKEERSKLFWRSRWDAKRLRLCTCGHAEPYHRNGPCAWDPAWKDDRCDCAGFRDSGKRGGG